MKGRALVAWNLRRIRVRRGLSQERLAFDAGVDRSYVGGLERQEENPTVDVLDRLAKTLAVHVSEFFCGAGERLLAAGTAEERPPTVAPIPWISLDDIARIVKRRQIKPWPFVKGRLGA